MEFDWTGGRSGDDAKLSRRKMQCSRCDFNVRSYKYFVSSLLCYTLRALMIDP
jgi:hypothetical protein